MPFPVTYHSWQTVNLTLCQDPPIKENFGVLLRTCVRSRRLSLYARTQRKTENAYILIELVPEACGTGFGVFCCVVLGLALLFIMAQYAMTWLLAPVAITMTLLQNETLWWILPTLFVVGARSAQTWL